MFYLVCALSKFMATVKGTEMNLQGEFLLGCANDGSKYMDGKQLNGI